MFVNFAIDNGIRFTAHFYDAKADKVETRIVTGWVTGDDGLSQATVLVPENGLQVRVGAFGNFIAVTPNGKEEEHQPLIDAKVAAMKKTIEEQNKATAAASPTVGGY
jgi:hypothetical protein